MLTRSVYTGRLGAPVPLHCSFPGRVLPPVSLLHSQPQIYRKALGGVAWMFAAQPLARVLQGISNGHWGPRSLHNSPFLVSCTIDPSYFSSYTLSLPPQLSETVFCVCSVWTPALVPRRRTGQIPVGGPYLSGIAVFPCMLSTT